MTVLVYDAKVVVECIWDVPTVVENVLPRCQTGLVAPAHPAILNPFRVVQELPMAPKELRIRVMRELIHESVHLAMFATVE